MLIPYCHTVQYYETDQMGIIHHSNYIRWMEEARIAYMDEMDFPSGELEDDRRAGYQELAERIDQADAVVIGGGSGLSSAAGYDHYHWSPALSEALAPFREQYGFTSPLAGFYHCFSSYGEQWGYYSQYILSLIHI